MSAIIIVGAQWGDEGKGKATDILGGKVDYVVKPNGGNNAGHTVVVGGEKYELKLLPAGVLSENATPILGNGVVVNLEALFEEIDGLEARGANASRLKVSANAHLVAPYHQQLDRVQERFLGKRAIGTTGRGIGPTYADKVARVGLRVQDVFDESILRQKIESALDVKNQMLVKMYNRRAISVEETMDYFGRYAERLAPMVVDAERVLNDALSRGEHVLMEGGQATMLDVDHGTYPFVSPLVPTRRFLRRQPVRRTDASRVLAGRALQSGGEEIAVLIDGILRPRPVSRVTFYRHLRDIQSVREP